MRPSGASAAVVRLAREGNELVATVADDGTGIAQDRSAGGGIRGMRERVELAGGSLEVAPGERSGTVLTARLPWDGTR